MKAAAARGLADLVDDRELDADMIIPSVFDRRVAPAVSRAVQETAERPACPAWSSPASLPGPAAHPRERP